MNKSIFFLSVFASLAGGVRATTTLHVLSGGNFTQNWSDLGLVTVDDDWSNVPSIMGYRGDGSISTGVDPSTLLSDSYSAVADVIANQTNTTITNGGVAEFEIADPVVALQGSGTADAPNLVIYLDTTGMEFVTISYDLRDIDGSADNSVQPVALQYRVGSTGDFSNVSMVADASSGPSLATLVTPVTAVLPVGASNQPQVQIRIMTSNAGGSDEWVGIDNIVVSATAIVPEPSSALAALMGIGLIGLRRRR